MFGPIRGEWTDDEWKGWWGDDPRYRHPTFVLTHHARELDHEVPLLLGSGERLFEDLTDAPNGYEIAEFVGTPAALHVRFVRNG
jgi:hypothetical protein